MDPVTAAIHQPSQCLCTGSPAPSRRRLILAFDGTENKFGAQSSHVVEFYSRIVKSGDQPSYYTSGIGTYAKKSGRVSTVLKNKWASITAWNFKSNLLAGYQWLSENYQQGDQIFLLGFSRGAYQARVLAAMVTKIGLIRTGNKEQIPFAFEIYRDAESSVEMQVFPDGTVPAINERNRDSPNGYTVTTAAKEFKKAFCYDVNIHFVGVWDTVSSVGLFRGKYYPGAQSAENICFFRHALALDERRVKFLPEYVGAPREWFQPGEFGPPRCKEVWFRGCHSDVGGGRRINFTSDNGGVPSRWMAYEAMLAGLEMTPFHKNFAKQDLTGRPPTTSMTGFYKFFEYVPLISWADPSVSPVDDASVPKFTRSRHRARPRKIHDHQKLHVSVGLLDYVDSHSDTLADLPDAWQAIGWREVCQLLLRATSAIPETPSETALDLAQDSHHSPRPASPAYSSIISESVRNVLTKASVSVDRLSRSSSIASQASSRSIGFRGDSPSVATAPGPPTLGGRMSSPDANWAQIRQQLDDAINAAGSLSTRPLPITQAADVVKQSPPVPPYSQQAYDHLIAAFELDILDYEDISILIALVRKKSNTIEFLERLNLIAHSPEGRRELYADSQFTEMLLEVLELQPAKPQETMHLILKRIEVGLRLVSKVTRCYDRKSSDYDKLQKAIWLVVANEDVRGLSLERALIVLLQPADNTYSHHELEIFLRRLPELSEDGLNRLKLGQTADTAKADIILAVISALSDSEANTAILLFLLQRLGGTLGQTLDSKLLQVLKRRLETPSFWGFFAEQTELLTQVLSLISDEVTRADGMAIISGMLQDDVCSGAVFEAGIFDMLMDDEPEWRQIFLSEVIEKRPALAQCYCLQSTKTTRIAGMMTRLVIGDNVDGSEILLKILVPLAQFIPQTAPVYTRMLYSYLVEHVQGAEYSKGSRRAVALCLVVLFVANALVAQLVQPDRHTLEYAFQLLGYQAVWDELWTVTVPETEPEESERTAQAFLSATRTIAAQERQTAIITAIRGIQRVDGAKDRDWAVDWAIHLLSAHIPGLRVPPGVNPAVWIQEVMDERKRQERYRDNETSGGMME